MPSYHDVYPEKWLQARHLEGKPRTVTITRVFMEPVFNPNTKKHEQRLVAAMTNTEKLLTINVSNARTLEEISGTDQYDNWVGLRVRLEPGRAPNGKDTILIKPAPAAAPKPEVHGTQGEPLVHGLENSEPPLVHGRDASTSVEEFSSAIADPKSAGDSQPTGEESVDGLFFSATDLEVKVRQLNMESAEPMSDRQLSFTVESLARFTGKGAANAQLILSLLVGRAATTENPPGVLVGKYLYELLKEGGTLPHQTEALRAFCERQTV